MVPIIILCGQAGVGKDTLSTYLSYNHGATCLALADPLKRICQYVFDFTDEQLWGPSELRGKIDERYKTVGTLKRCTEKVRFTPLNKFCGIKLNEIPDGSFGDWYLKCQGKAYSTGLTPRYCLQTLGTEWGRAIDPNLWIKIALDTATKLLEDPTLFYIPSKGIQKKNPDVREWKTEGIVITDGRFRNEILEIKKIGGIAVGIRRNGLLSTPKTHQSETELEAIPLHWFDYLLWNNGTIRELNVKADILVSKVWNRSETL